MLNARVVAENHLKYRNHINIILKEMERINVRPMSDVWIYPDEPTGLNWHGIVGGNNGEKDGFYIFTCRYGEITHEIQPCWGFRPNGSLIIK